MTTSTGATIARDALSPAYYLWQAPGKPVSVHVSLEVVDRLEREVIESFKAITKRGSEIGGVLLGRAVGSPSAVIVEAYEGVPCDYSRGPLYLLADEDKARLAATLQRLKVSPEKGLSVVGFFRSNTRRDLALDEDDLALMSEFFAQPQQVCLLVKPFSMKPSLASFFIWEGGRMESQAAPLQFPFKCSELLKAEHAKAIVSGDQLPSAAPAVQSRVDGAPAVAPLKPEPRVLAPPEVPKREEPAPPPKPEPRVMAPPVVPKREEPAPPLPAPPKPEPRVMAPPVVAKREETAPPPAVPPRPEPRVTAPPVVLKREAPAPPAAPKTEARPPVTPSPVRREEPAPSRSDVRPVATAGGVKREETAPPPKPEVRAAAPAVTPKREEAAPSPAPSRPEPAAPAAKKEDPAPPAAARREEIFMAAALPEERTSRTRLYLIAAALAVALIGTSGYLYMRSGGGSPAATSAADAAGLALRVERNAGQLLLSWNREATVVRTAQKAVLSIFDGDHREDVELDLGQLRSGSIVYSPITNDVSFRLDVVDATGKSVNESVRVIAGRPSPAAPLGQAAPTRQESAPAESRTRPEPAQAAAAVTRAPAEPAAGPSPTPGGGAEPPAPAPSKPAPQTTPARADSLAARLSTPSTPPEPPGLEVASTAAARPAETPSSAAPPAAQIPKPTPPQSTPSQPVPAPTTSAPAQPAAAPAQPATAPPQEQAPSVPLRVGGNVQQAKVIREVTPVYPPLARQARVSGVVRVEATVGRDGRIVRVQAISGPPLLRQAAVDAVRQWVYRPTLLNGQPVEVITQVDVTFNLNR